jgi:hypothetical protein
MQIADFCETVRYVDVSDCVLENHLFDNLAGRKMSRLKATFCGELDFDITWVETISARSRNEFREISTQSEFSLKVD